MAKSNQDKKVVVKRTAQGGNSPKTASMNKHQKRGFKPDRGQG